MCVHFLELWSFENYTSKFIPHLWHKIMWSFSPSPFIHLLLPSSSYPWLPMVVSFFLTHLLLEVASPIIFLPSPFHCHWTSRSKGLHWWRRSKAYKLHMELHQNTSIIGEFNNNNIILTPTPIILIAEIIQTWGIDVAPCRACRPWIFFINGVFCFLKMNDSRMENEEIWLEAPLQGEYESRRSSPP